MLLSLVASFAVSTVTTVNNVFAEVTEAGGDDFCYAGESDEDDGSDGTGVAPGDKVITVPIKIKDESATGKKAMKEIADAIGKKLHILPALVYAQMCQEAGPNGDSVLARQSKNFSGIKGSGGGVPTDGTGGEYQKFNSLSEYASRFAGILKSDGLSGVKDPADYVHRLKMMRYFTASEESYLAGVKALMAGYYGSNPNGAVDGAGAAGDDSSTPQGSWHKGDDSFAPDSLETTWTSGYGGNGGQQEDDSDDDTQGADAATGNWKDKNSDAYKNAKKAFNFLTKKLGFSGAGAAGVLGNFAIESGFNPQASNGTHFGLAQWSQERLNAGNMKGNDNSTLTFENEMKLVQKELNGNYKSVKSKVGRASDVKQAADDWDALYEVSGGASDGQRESAAEFFYKEFKGSSIDANDSLLGDASDAAIDATDSDDNSSKQNSGACGNGDGDSASSGDWDWPFKGVKDPPDYMDGGQFGNSAGSVGARGTSFHDGFDWSFGMNGVHSGSTVYAIHGGTVKDVKYASGLDWYVWVHSPDGYNEVYQETFDKSDIKVHEGQTVKTGDEIGTAHLNGHMHLGITKVNDFAKAEGSWNKDDGTWLDPVKVIKGENTDQK